MLSATQLEKQLSSPKGRLVWFLNFLNSNIGSLPRLDLINLDFALHAMRGDIDLTREDDPETVVEVDQGRRLELKEIQDRLKEVLEGVLAIKGKIPPAAEDEKGLQRARRRSKRLWLEKYSLEMSLCIKGNHLVFEPLREIDQVFLQFISDLSQFSVDAIRTCERHDCNKFFLKATQKEKRYCSNKCAWVMNSRAKRAENLEKEREKKRKSYERKIKEKLPGAKVTRRPRSTSEKDSEST